MPLKRKHVAPKRQRKTGSTSEAPNEDSAQTSRPSRRTYRPEQGRFDRFTTFLPPSVEAGRKFAYLSQRKVIPSRFFDHETLQQLGLFEEVKNLCQKIHWMEFFDNVCPRTYEQLTWNFLSTFNFETRPEMPNFGECTFNLGNTDYQISLARFNSLFGFLNEGDCEIPPGFNDNAFWFEITGEHYYNARLAKSNSIKSPALRYIHRVLSHSLFARGDNHGAINRTELYVLHCMVYGRMFNAGYFLLTKFVDVAKRTKGDIGIGGLITVIAQALCGFDPTFHNATEALGKNKVDMDTLSSMGLVKMLPSGQYVLKSGQEEKDGAGTSEQGTTSAGHSISNNQLFNRVVVLEEKIDGLQASVNSRIDTLENHIMDQLNAFFQHVGFQPPPPED